MSTSSLMKSELKQQSSGRQQHRKSNRNKTEKTAATGEEISSTSTCNERIEKNGTGQERNLNTDNNNSGGTGNEQTTVTTAITPSVLHNIITEPINVMPIDDSEVVEELNRNASTTTVMFINQANTMATENSANGHHDNNNTSTNHTVSTLPLTNASNGKKMVRLAPSRSSSRVKKKLCLNPVIANSKLT